MPGLFDWLPGVSWGAPVFAKPDQQQPIPGAQYTADGLPYFPPSASGMQAPPQSPAAPPQAVQNAAWGMAVQPFVDAYHAVKGNMTPEEAQNFAIGAAMGVLPIGRAGRLATAVEDAAPSIAKGIRAYHGSPHDFDRFDLSKIGTGEGAQAYGHGLYFAENEGVAKNYRDMLTMDASLRAGERVPGHMYEVNINASPDQLLDWDAPINTQSPLVQNYIKQNTAIAPLRGHDMTILDALTSDPKWKNTWDAAGEDRAWMHLRNMLPNASDDYLQSVADRVRSHVINGTVPESATGKSVVQRLQANKSPAAVSANMRDAGLAGIKYLDQGSRGTGDGTRNYVVFDDKLIDILRKYGLAGLLGGGAASQLPIPSAQPPVFASQ